MAAKEICYSWRMKKSEPCGNCLFDIHMAFNKADSGFLFRILDEIRVRLKFRGCIRSLNDSSELRALVNGKLIRAVKVERGTMQDYPLSPSLYVYVKKVIAQRV